MLEMQGIFHDKILKPIEYTWSIAKDILRIKAKKSSSLLCGLN